MRILIPAHLAPVKLEVNGASTCREPELQVTRVKKTEIRLVLT